MLSYKTDVLWSYIKKAFIVIKKPFTFALIVLFYRMNDRPTDQTYYILDAHWYRKSSQNNSAVYFEQQPRKITYPHTVTDWRTGKVNYRVVSLLKLSSNFLMIFFLVQIQKVYFYFVRINIIIDNLSFFNSCSEKMCKC